MPCLPTHTTLPLLLPSLALANASRQLLWEAFLPSHCPHCQNACSAGNFLSQVHATIPGLTTPSMLLPAAAALGCRRHRHWLFRLLPSA